MKEVNAPIVITKKNFYHPSGYKQPCPVAHEYRKILAYDDYENFHPHPHQCKKHRCGISSDGNMPGNDDDGDIYVIVILENQGV